MIGIASVLLVITPISWILLHQPQNDPADASVPMVTRTDDTYITPSTKPVVVPPTKLPTTPPTAKPTATPTPTPTDSDTPTPTDSASPTDGPTKTPTKESTSVPTQAPTSPGHTVTTKPNPSTPPTTTVPPPPVDGGMDSDEMQLFNLIDNARVNNGCARLKQDPNLTTGARSDADNRASTGKKLNSGSGSSAGAGGDGMSAQQAFNQMMDDSNDTILNCSLTTLGVGTGDATYRSGGILCGIGFCTSTKTRVAWVADFS